MKYLRSEFVFGVPIYSEIAKDFSVSHLPILDQNTQSCKVILLDYEKEKIVGHCQ